MKYLVITFFLVLAATEIFSHRNYNEKYPEPITRASRSLTTQLENFLNLELREIMKNGNSSLGIPVLDPFEQPEVNFDFDKESIQMSAQLTDVFAKDLSTYIVRVATVSLISQKATIGLTFPSIYAKGNYSIKGVVMKDVPIFGDGEFELTVRDFQVDAVIAVRLIGRMSVKSIELKIVLGGLDCTITGIYHDENTSVLLSAVISDMAPEIISDYHDSITQFVSELMIDAINQMLEKPKEENSVE